MKWNGIYFLSKLSPEDLTDDDDDDDDNDDNDDNDSIGSYE